MNLIKQIVRPGEYGTQTIKMVVKSSERGAQGEKGKKGDAATITAGNAYSVEDGQSPAVINTGTSSDAVFDFYIPKGEKGDDGAIQYTAGTGINITSENVIEATGDATAAWGGIQGNIASQTDLQNEFGLYTKTADLPNIGTAYVGTSNLMDGAVTTSKFAQYATNNAMITANNLTPTDDTPAEWINLLGGTNGTFPTGKGGYFFGYYNVAGSFTNQPSQYGWLETIVEGNGIYQRWTNHADGPVFYRLGNAHGWYGVGGTGDFRQIIDNSDNSVVIRTSELTFNGCEATPQSQAFGFMAVKYGKMVFLGGKINITASKAAYTDLVTLPIEMSPVTSITTTVDGKTVDIRYGSSNSGGSIQCHAALSNGDTLQIATTYISR